LEKQPTLVVFCKRPVLHHGKQRLAAETNAETALSLARLMLDCTLEDTAQWPGPVVISPADKRDEGWASGLLDHIHGTIPQPEGNLGKRLQVVDSKLRESGHKKIVYIGTDVPVLNGEHYRQAYDALGEDKVILSPALDGGVTLMGSSRPWPDLLELPWSTDDLYASLAAVCQNSGMNIKLLPETYDVDTKADLVRLTEDLASDTRPARIRLLREVEKILGSA
jgi:rSAM/selenodomain-associated transferase 1